ncbi:d8920af7-8e60-4c58-bef1-835531458b4c [Sclerotinia trifoliorum]|uniref:D8920af7-8e60-4c58-bef1-835531458b4c n=1 Tax=Sclerotinia trifoliorum TaxID=28548 RepID=A0A8H2VPH7_9HELO|nr:d8920af7-8e60-4c58-bef1-835531458b4c [Sclerotinia trifoliorum]
MSDNSSTLYAKAVVEAQKIVHYVLDKAPGAYESGREAAVTAAAKIQPTLNSAIEKTPILIERSKEAAQQLYQDAPKHLGTAKVAAQKYYHDAPRHLDTAKQAGSRALENPSQSVRQLLENVGPVVRQHPYISGFVVWVALAAKFGPFWPVRALLKILGFGKGVTPGSTAASWQSRQGNVQRKSWFSLFQSYGNRLN